MQRLRGYIEERDVPNQPEGRIHLSSPNHWRVAGGYDLWIPFLDSINMFIELIRVQMLVSGTV